jgi:hypothetical protein
MDKKYQVFVSSTYEELKEHRDQAVKTILRMGHLPVGMEMFNAADSTQWDIIKRHIDKSDYYVVILAHRYGTIDKEDGVSYTEKEYNYALENGIPCLGFVIDSNTQWAPGLITLGEDATKLLAFKEKIKSKMVSFWTSSDNLALQLSSALSEAFNTKPRIGWVRANETTTSPLVAEELSKLSNENRELKAVISSLGKDNHEVVKSYELLDNIPYKFELNENSYSGTYLKLFSLVAKTLLNENGTGLLFAQVIKELTSIDVYLVDQYLRKELNELNFIEPFLERLAILGLVTSRPNPNPGSVIRKIWQLTETGRQLLVKIEHP